MKRAALILLLLSAGGASVMAKPTVREPLARFIHFYEQSDDMGLWERVVYCVLAVRST